MDRVALVVLSILAATGILVGASYGAIVFMPYLERIPTSWVLAVTSAMILIAALLVSRRKRFTRQEPLSGALKRRSF
jgi:hypothetical protein